MASRHRLCPRGPAVRRAAGSNPSQYLLHRGTMDQDLSTVRPGDDLDWYLEQAFRFPMLSAEEERRLAERWKNDRDDAASRQLLGSHLRLVVKIARGFGGYGLPLGDLIAEGNVGLMQALDKFEPERGFRFSTYAMWWIRAAIQEYVLHNRSLVKMGTTAAQKKLFFNLRRLKRELGELGDGDLAPEAVASIAEELEVTEDEVVEMNRRLAARDHSLTAPLREGGEAEWQDMLVAEGQDQESLVTDASELAWRRDLLAQGLRTLNERERRILTERRLKDDPMTLEELSAVYGVSRERVRQLEVRAFERLQKAMLAAAANDQARTPRLAA
jgi:RNA polymerase sigma-32 factor